MSDYQYGDELEIYEDDDYYPGLINQNSSGPPSKIKVEEMDGIYNKLLKALEEVNELVALGNDWSLILFAHYKWNHQKLQADYFNSMETILKGINFSKEKPIIQNVTKLCNTCLMNETCYLTNYCGHTFCLNCWKQNISYMVNNKVVFIKCMAQKCNCVLLDSTVKTLIESSPSNKQKYTKFMCQKYVQTNHNIKFCPGADCKYCIYSQNSLLNQVVCDCGEKFCFRCRSQVHRPCSCSDVVRWKELVMKQQANAKWLTLNTKICPFCKKHVERSMGCNYMNCAPPGGCGKAFCYVCSRSWEPDHKDHFKCNIYKPGGKQQQLMQKNKQILAKINFFCEKYLSNQHSKTKIHQANGKMADYQVQLFNVLGIQLNQSEFILGAYRFAKQACDALKWSYAYGFFMNQSIPKNKKQLFQFQQGQFQKWKQNLTMKLQQKFNKLVQNMVEDKKQKRPVDIQKRKAQFQQIKTEIITYYKAAQSQMNKLVNMVETELG